MARFRNKATDEIVGATRLKSSKEVETQDRGWITAGANTWEVVATIPGRRPLVVEDPDFREQYEPLDPSAEKMLAAPALGTQLPKHDPPAPPRHSKTQALPKVKTASAYAEEHREATHDISGGVDPVSGKPLTEVDAIDPTTGQPKAEEPELEVDENLAIDVEVDEPAAAPKEDLTIETPKPAKKKTKKKPGKKKKK